MHLTDPQSMDRYAYARNDPLGYVDPSGLDWWDWFGGGWGGGGWGGGSIWDERLPWDWGMDWQTLLFGPPDPSKLIINDWDGNCAGRGCAYTPPGIRAPGQTFGDCMKQHKNDYSLGGVADLAAGALGRAAGIESELSIMSIPGVEMVAGNSIAGIVSALSGDAKDAATTMATNAPDLVRGGMGSTITAGRRSADITALNIAGKGGLPKALSSASNGVKSFLGSVSKVLNLGMNASTRAGIDIGLYGAEALGCTFPQ